MTLVTQDEGLMTPDQLHKITRDIALAEQRRAYEELKKAEENRKAAHQAFMEMEIPPDAMKRLMAGVKQAAEQGKHEFLVFQFPAEELADGGRRVNNSLPDWPESLTGFAKRAYAYYLQHLKPAGYKLRVEVLDYPNGKLGDIGFFLHW